ncbi:MAG: O-antigen ligase family protein [Burkholderiales bacterium]|nr:O-antigen ligase family protein [Burkholderiales bacterium]
MSKLAIALLVIASIALLAAPRRWAALPLLVGGCYLPSGLGMELGPFNMYPLRWLLACALIRITLRGERARNRMHGLDWMMWLWAAAALMSSFFYADVGATLINRLGLVYTACATYFVFRALCQSEEDVVTLCRITAYVLTPIALAMLYERLTGHNLFSAFGGINEVSEVRAGTIRAQGPFAHSILAGSVGAVSLPLMAVLWKPYRMASILGIAACLTMVYSTASSGPIMSTGFAILALLMWPWRRHMRLMRWTALLGYIALNRVMNAPAYYLLARIDLTGSSTSWHRAALIDAAIDHISEWWLAGTSHTRGWMPYGVPWSANHADITNYYLRMGVDGGLPLMLLFIAVLAKGFSCVGRALRQQQSDTPSRVPFVAWALGSSLFAHAATFLAVSYFDQSVVFLYVTLAAMGSSALSEAPLPVQSAPSESPLLAETACST